MAHEQSCAIIIISHIKHQTIFQHLTNLTKGVIAWLTYMKIPIQKKQQRQR